MSLIKINPFTNSRSLSDAIDEFFNTGVKEIFGTETSNNTPSVNVIENEDKYKIEVAAPGLQKKDFKVEIENNQLKVAAEQQHAEEVKEENYTRREFNYTSFKRSFRLPDTVKGEEVKADYKNGVLSISLPKKEKSDAEKAKKIEIK